MNQELHRLGPAEAEVVHSMARARPIEDIVADLGLPVAQVEKLIESALEKLSAYQNHSPGKDEGGEAGPEIEELDSRHLEILEAIEAGHTNLQIAAALKRRPGYVKKLIEEIFQALHVHNRTEAAVRYANWRGRRHRGAE